MAAREHGHGAHECAGRRCVDEVGEHEHEAALAARDAAERELVVAVGVDGLDVEERARDGRGSQARGGDVAEHAAGEGDRAAAVAEHIRGRADRDQPVEGDVEQRAALAGRGAQAAAVEQAAQLAVLVDAVLVGHRPPEARRRAPVDLADVVIGRVLAHGLERRPEPVGAA